VHPRNCEQTNQQTNQQTNRKTDNGKRRRHAADKHVSDKTSGDKQGGGGRAPRTVLSRELLGGARMVIIRHDEEEYRLQVTSSGKLILTK